MPAEVVPMQVQTEPVSPMHPVPFRIVDTCEEMPGCTTIRVEPAAKAGTSDFSPGQFYMIYVFGHGEVPISVSGDDPAAPGQLIFTVMAVGSVTQALCAAKAGDTIGLRGPFGSAWPVDDLAGRDLVVMAGGLGLAPLRPAIYRFLRQREAYGDLAILYGTRQPRSILFRQQLQAWQEHPSLEVAITVDNAGRDWLGKVGVVTALLQGRKLNPATTSALICGPELMMRFSAYALLDLGVEAEDIYVSMERNMQCAVKTCGRCQYGPFFVCADGPVFSFDRVERLFMIREV
jgi:NAD(P)H-flavin reductase